MADPAQASVPTPNYNFNLPLVGGDDNAWGGLLNDNWSSIDTLLWNVSGVANAALTQAAADARYLQLSGGTLGPNSLIVNGPAQFANYVQFTGSSRFDCSVQANFTGGATFGTAQVFFNSQVTFSADALMVTPSASDNSDRAATTAWVNGAIAALPAPPAPSTTPPAMDGTAAPGSSALYARGDHVHPSDTSRLALTGGTLTGPLTLAADPVNPLDAADKQYVDAGDLGGGPGGFVNKLRNGTFDVWQRGTSINVPQGTPTYTADGWIVACNGAAMSVSIATPGSSGRGYNQLTLQGAAGMTDAWIGQRIEAQIASLMGAAPLTFQIMIYNATGGPVTPNLWVLHPTALDNYASTITDINAQPLQSCANSAWTQVAYTFSVPLTTLQLGLQVHLDFGALLSASGKNVYFAQADLRATPRLPVGLNANPPPPELRPIATEMQFCQRYYQTGNWGLAGYGAADVSQVSYFALPVPMRATPTINYNLTNSANVTSASPNAENNAYIGNSIISAASGGYIALGTFVASAEL